MSSSGHHSRISGQNPIYGMWKKQNFSTAQSFCCKETHFRVSTFYMVHIKNFYPSNNDHTIVPGSKSTADNHNIWHCLFHAASNWMWLATLFPSSPFYNVTHNFLLQPSSDTAEQMAYDCLPGLAGLSVSQLNWVQIYFDIAADMRWTCYDILDVMVSLVPSEQLHYCTPLVCNSQ